MAQHYSFSRARYDTTQEQLLFIIPRTAQNIKITVYVNMTAILPPSETASANNEILGLDPIKQERSGYLWQPRNKKLPKLKIIVDIKMYKFN